jgi:predicted nucleic acid-binding protein
VTYLLDSSAFCAFFFGQPGRIRVEELLEDENARIEVSVLTAVELWARLKAEGHQESFAVEWEEHRALFDQILPVDEVIAGKAIELREKSASRLPTIDSLIAASAAVNGAILVHCDPHFLSIPSSLLTQEVIAR